MSELFSGNRSRVARDHALIAPESHVTSPLVGWSDADGTILISPAMRGAEGGPRFVQYIAAANGKPATTRGAAADVERLVFVLAGSATLDGKPLAADHFAWFPPGDAYELALLPDAKLLVFEKKYKPLAETAIPKRVVGSFAGRRPNPSSAIRRHSSPHCCRSSRLSTWR